MASDTAPDVEKSAPGATTASLSDTPEAAPTSEKAPLSRLRALDTRIKSLSGFEARGITRVPPEERIKVTSWDIVSIALLWFSANVSVNTLAVSLFGPLLFGLGYLDSAMCAFFGVGLGCLTTAYMATWGPRSGCRTMVVLRYFMGYWPAKLTALLNIILMIGYCTINAIIAGQMLSAVNGGSMTIAVGIVVVQIVCFIVTVFGMKLFQIYERFAWIPQILVLFVLIGSAAPYFDTSAQSVGDSAILAANRLSYFSLCLSVSVSWGGAAADFFCYYPENTPRWKVFVLSLTGLVCAFSLVFMIGIGLATGVATNPTWEAAYALSTGALIVEGYAPLRGFGGFCGAIVALGLISNSIPSIYSASLGCQVLGRHGKKVPRYVWATALIILQLVLALAGREHLMAIISNFVALMGYWTQFMVYIVIMEHALFRRVGAGGPGFDWTKWQDKQYLPIGYAALASFLLGWVGAILGMYQVWYTGPLAVLAGPADIGTWVGTGFTMVSFVPLRWLELKFVGR
ncbi:vitamin B6 transporter TPN1 [Podospora aff. communis PSN243]|uniref:Vitamin B6 transporter TPN1 n=1 Tax=Podospora aff. communis PSN243 TaxID=3040156 RepID=A0AAV9GHH2_9PEZI|nr:vitamin B6 transporter TPN1 [Podospora aff. communis PSN243]